MNSGDFLERAVSIASKEFVRGFIIGQVALLLVLIVLLRFLFFRGANTSPVRRITFMPAIGHGKRKLAEWGQEDATDVQRETCEWMNVLLRQLVLRPLREHLEMDENFLARTLSAALLSGEESPSPGPTSEGGDPTTRGSTDAISKLGPIEVTSFTLGSTDPALDWICSRDGNTWEVQLHWDQAARCEVETSLLMCWPPKHPIATLPCSFAFSLPRLQARLQLQMGGPTKQPGAEKTAKLPPRTPSKMHLSISLLPDDFCLDVEIHSLIGHRSKLKDVPRLTSLLQARLKGAIRRHLLHPHSVSLMVSSPLEALLGHLSPPLTHAKGSERDGRASRATPW